MQSATQHARAIATHRPCVRADSNRIMQRILNNPECIQNRRQTSARQGIRMRVALAWIFAVVISVVMGCERADLVWETKWWKAPDRRVGPSSQPVDVAAPAPSNGDGESRKRNVDASAGARDSDRRVRSENAARLDRHRRPKPVTRPVRNTSRPAQQPADAGGRV